MISTKQLSTQGGCLQKLLKKPLPQKIYYFPPLRKIRLNLNSNVRANKSALYLSILSSTYSKNEPNDFSFFSNKLPEQTALADPYLAAYSLSQLQRQLEGVTKSRSLAPDIAYVKTLSAVLGNYIRRIFHSQEI